MSKMTTVLYEYKNAFYLKHPRSSYNVYKNKTTKNKQKTTLTKKVKEYVNIKENRRGMDSKRIHKYRQNLQHYIKKNKKTTEQVM